MVIYDEVKVGDKVRITKRKYKGGTGTVIFIFEGECTVQLESRYEDIVVPVSYCEVIND